MKVFDQRHKVVVPRRCLLKNVVRSNLKQKYVGLHRGTSGAVAASDKVTAVVILSTRDR